MPGKNEVTIYVDGACLGNPGPGGYGVLLDEAGIRKEKSGGFRMTTNNRMEIMAAIVGLESLPRNYRVTVFSDSQYLVRAMTEGWVTKWKSNGWMRNSKEKALNPDLWKRLLIECEKHEVFFKWIRGHNNHTENEICDRMANEAAQRTGLPSDKGYEESPARLF